MQRVSVFPHLLVCMGFVAQTNNDLWGVHLTTAGAHSQERDSQRAQLPTCTVAATARYGTGVSTPHVNWMDEMESFARVLGWHGSAHGFDTSILDPRNDTYVEYRRRLAGLCRIFYKLHKETESTRVLQFHDSRHPTVYLTGRFGYPGVQEIVSRKDGHGNHNRKWSAPRGGLRAAAGNGSNLMPALRWNDPFERRGSMRPSRSHSKSLS
jgi:hypothetical protein